MLAHEQFGVERFGPRPEAGDRHHLALLGEVDHDRRDASDVDQIALQHAERDAGGDPGIHRVAARLQYVEPGGRGEIMPGSDGVAGYGDGRAMGGIMRSCGHDVSPARPLPQLTRACVGRKSEASSA